MIRLFSKIIATVFKVKTLSGNNLCFVNFPLLYIYTVEP